MTIPEDTGLRAWHWKRLQWSLQALADAGAGQPLLFPERAPTADELAFDFDHWASFVRGTYPADLSTSQSDALDALDRALQTMSRDGAEFGLDLWTDAALRTSEQWAGVRRLAETALEAFGWRGTEEPESAAEQSDTVVR
jgi:hypothetical protein